MKGDERSLFCGCSDCICILFASFTIWRSILNNCTSGRCLSKTSSTNNTRRFVNFLRLWRIHSLKRTLIGFPPSAAIASLVVAAHLPKPLHISVCLILSTQIPHHRYQHQQLQHRSRSRRIRRSRDPCRGSIASCGCRGCCVATNSVERFQCIRRACRWSLLREDRQTARLLTRLDFTINWFLGNYEKGAVEVGRVD